MELLIIGLILYFGGKWIVRKTGADKPSFICRDCARVSRGFDHCIFCCEHGQDRPNCEQCLLEGKRIDTSTIPATGEYEPPEAHWASQYEEPSDEELFGHA